MPAPYEAPDERFDFVDPHRSDVVFHAMQSRAHISGWQLRRADEIRPGEIATADGVA